MDDFMENSSKDTPVSTKNILFSVPAVLISFLLLIWSAGRIVSVIKQDQMFQPM